MNMNDMYIVKRLEEVCYNFSKQLELHLAKKKKKTTTVAQVISISSKYPSNHIAMHLKPLKTPYQLHSNTLIITENTLATP